MHSLSVKLNLTGRRCVILGGGSIAARRAKALVEAGAEVIIIAPRIHDSIAAMKVTLHRRPFGEGDLHGAFLAVIATDDAAVNARAAGEARAAGAIVNRADDHEQSDLLFPAVARVGPITIAVDTGSAMPEACKTIRDSLIDSLDEDWPVILQIASTCRERIRADIDDPTERRDRIRRLTDADAVALFKSQGEETYRRYCQSIAEGSIVEPVAEGTHD